MNWLRRFYWSFTPKDWMFGFGFTFPVLNYDQILTIYSVHTEVALYFGPCTLTYERYKRVHKPEIMADHGPMVQIYDEEIDEFIMVPTRLLNETT